MKKNILASLTLGVLLLTACSDSADAGEEPTTNASPTPSATVAAPPTEAELIEWVEGRESFGEKYDATDFLDAQAMRTYKFFCRQMDATSLPSEVMEDWTDSVFRGNPAWGVGDPSRHVREDNGLAELIGLERRRTVQYEVATTIECPRHKAAFESWSASR